MSYELIDHTADTGLDLESDTLENLFSDAVDGMMHVLGLDGVRPDESATRSIHVEPASLDLMLVDLLREVLALYDARSFAPDSVRIRELSEEDGVRAEVRGEPFDPDRHRPEIEIKGVTYHGLYVERQGSKWVGRVIFDL